jgi:hypothetical protein
MTKKDAKSTCEKLEGLRAGLNARATNDRERTWLDERWLVEVVRAHGKVGPNRWWFFVVRIGQVSGAAALPVFATAGTLTTGEFWGWVTVAVSLVLALLVGLDYVYRPGVRWRVAYQSYHDLIDAAWAYLEAPEDARPQDEPGAQGDSATADAKPSTHVQASPPQDPYQTFVLAVETTIANQQSAYLRDIANLNTAAPSADGTSGETRAKS